MGDGFIEPEGDPEHAHRVLAAFVLAPILTGLIAALSIAAGGAAFFSPFAGFFGLFIGLFFIAPIFAVTTSRVSLFISVPTAFGPTAIAAIFVATRTPAESLPAPSLLVAIVLFLAGCTASNLFRETKQSTRDT